MTGSSARVLSGHMPRPRKPRPSFSPIALTWLRWRPASAQVWWRCSRGAPESSSWPAGSRLTAPSGPVSAMTLPPSSTGSQPTRSSPPAGRGCRRARHRKARDDRRSDRRTSRARCRSASRSRGFSPLAKMASRSSRLSIDVVAFLAFRCASSSRPSSGRPGTPPAGFDNGISGGLIGSTDASRRPPPSTG